MGEPTILPVTNASNPYAQIMDALLRYLFVRTHAHTRETLVIILPTEGPSLAAALFAWVESWWDGAAEDRLREAFGSPEVYLLGFGVVVPEDPNATFSPSCPYCGDEALDVVSATFYADGMPLGIYGFSPLDVSSFDTDDVTVACRSCRRRFSVERVTL